MSQDTFTPAALRVLPPQAVKVNAWERQRKPSGSSETKNVVRTCRGRPMKEQWCSPPRALVLLHERVRNRGPRRSQVAVGGSVQGAHNPTDCHPGWADNANSEIRVACRLGRGIVRLTEAWDRRRRCRSTSVRSVASGALHG
jgi:hypothetical protein